MNLEQLLGLLTVGIKKNASDIHLEVGYPPSYRIQGELFAAKLDRLTAAETLALATHILGPKDPFILGTRNDVDRSFGLPGVSRFRASIFRQRGTVGLVLRVIPFEVPAIRPLNLPPVVQSIAGARNGLVLVTGATGNGKSTTIAAMLDHVNKTERLHLVMIEDPIEYLLPAEKSVIIQREIGTDADSFESALRAAMRQDPDIIMVGEMRDRETAETCLKAAETGHMVISSLHTPDAMRTIGRFTGMFASEEHASVRHRLADNLKAVISQRLIMRLDGRGLIPAVEVLVVTRAVQEAIRDPSKHDTLTGLMEKGRTDVGMQTFDQHLIDLVRSQAISADVAVRSATRRGDVERALMLGES